MTASSRGYRPIADYAIIGDAHTAALVARDGSIDWCCWPRFDSPAVFCRLLDAGRGGWFRVGPVGPANVERRYVGTTNVVATTFTTDDGRLRVTDCMPVEPRRSDRRGEDIRTTLQIVRLVEGLAGHVETEITFRPTFDFARAATAIAPRPGGAIAHAGAESIVLSCPVAMEREASGALVGRRRVSAGDRLWVTAAYRSGDPPSDTRIRSEADAEAALAGTLAYWEDWSAKCIYRGPYDALVHRSALALKLLTFEPTGALVAAPTTSLPETIRGLRNWDYRYTWLRDASLILYALQSLGYHEEAMDFFDWLETLCLCCQDDFQIIYTLDGSPVLPERTLPHLDGYRGSRPVRIGNAAGDQLQLDIYGEILDAAHLCYERMRPIRSDLWAVLRLLADRAAERWRKPDQGIWEVRSGPQHFLHSKLLCWVAVDRALRLAESAALAGDIANWRRSRDEIRAAILEAGYDAKIGAFTQAFGTSALDASALVMPLVGFSPRRIHVCRPRCGEFSGISRRAVLCTAIVRTTDCPAMRGPSRCVPSGSSTI